MKKKMRKFEEGGLSKAQEEWLGGADRSDPIIMARMRRAVPDEPKAAPKADTGELRDETGATSKIRRNTETGDLYSTEAPTPKPAPKAEAKSESKPAPKAEPKAAPKTESKKASGEEPSFFKGTKGYKNLGALFKSMREKAGITSYKSGGSVKSSASRRADGCAIRGKTKGRMV